jgi:hypothetical protein
VTALIVICSVAVALATAVVVDGLRMHAAVLRRFHQLDPDGGAEWEARRRAG